MKQLEKICERCNATGKDPDGGYYLDTFPSRNNFGSTMKFECKACDGIGKVPTEYGQEVLDFVRKHNRQRMSQCFHDMVFGDRV